MHKLTVSPSTPSQEETNRISRITNQQSPEENRTNNFENVEENRIVAELDCTIESNRAEIVKNVSGGHVTDRGVEGEITPKENATRELIGSTIESVRGEATIGRSFLKPKQITPCLDSAYRTLSETEFEISKSIGSLVHHTKEDSSGLPISVGIKCTSCLKAEVDQSSDAGFTNRGVKNVPDFSSGNAKLTGMFKTNGEIEKMPHASTITGMRTEDIPPVAIITNSRIEDLSILTAENSHVMKKCNEGKTKSLASTNTNRGIEDKSDVSTITNRGIEEVITTKKPLVSTNSNRGMEDKSAVSTISKRGKEEVNTTEMPHAPTNTNKGMEDKSNEEMLEIKLNGNGMLQELEHRRLSLENVHQSQPSEVLPKPCTKMLKIEDQDLETSCINKEIFKAKHNHNGNTCAGGKIAQPALIENAALINLEVRDNVFANSNLQNSLEDSVDEVDATLHPLQGRETIGKKLKAHLLHEENKVDAMLCPLQGRETIDKEFKTHLLNEESEVDATLCPLQGRKGIFKEFKTHSLKEESEVDATLCLLQGREIIGEEFKTHLLNEESEVDATLCPLQGRTTVGEEFKTHLLNEESEVDAKLCPLQGGETIGKEFKTHLLNEESEVDAKLCPLRGRETIGKRLPHEESHRFENVDLDGRNCIDKEKIRLNSRDNCRKGVPIKLRLMEEIEENGQAASQEHQTVEFRLLEEASKYLGSQEQRKFELMEGNGQAASREHQTVKSSEEESKYLGSQDRRKFELMEEMEGNGQAASREHQTVKPSEEESKYLGSQDRRKFETDLGNEIVDCDGHKTSLLNEEEGSQQREAGYGNTDKCEESESLHREDCLRGECKENLRKQLFNLSVARKREATEDSNYQCRKFVEESGKHCAGFAEKENVKQRSRFEGRSTEQLFNPSVVRKHEATEDLNDQCTRFVEEMDEKELGKHCAGFAEEENVEECPRFDGRSTEQLFNSGVVRKHEATEDLNDQCTRFVEEMDEREFGKHCAGFAEEENVEECSRFTENPRKQLFSSGVVRKHEATEDLNDQCTRLMEGMDEKELGKHCTEFAEEDNMEECSRFAENSTEQLFNSGVVLKHEATEDLNDQCRRLMEEMDEKELEKHCAGFADEENVEECPRFTENPREQLCNPSVVRKHKATEDLNDQCTRLVEEMDEKELGKHCAGFAEEENVEECPRFTENPRKQLFNSGVDRKHEATEDLNDQCTRLVEEMDEKELGKHCVGFAKEENVKECPRFTENSREQLFNPSVVRKHEATEGLSAQCTRFVGEIKEKELGKHCVGVAEEENAEECPRFTEDERIKRLEENKKVRNVLTSTITCRKKQSLDPTVNDTDRCKKQSSSYFSQEMHNPDSKVNSRDTGDMMKPQNTDVTEPSSQGIHNSQQYKVNSKDTGDITKPKNTDVTDSCTRRKPKLTLILKNLSSSFNNNQNSPKSFEDFTQNSTLQDNQKNICSSLNSDQRRPFEDKRQRKDKNASAATQNATAINSLPDDQNEIVSSSNENSPYCNPFENSAKNCFEDNSLQNDQNASAKICFQENSLQDDQNASAKICFQDDSLQNVQNASAKICCQDDSLQNDQNASVKICFRDNSLQDDQNASAKICFQDDFLQNDQNASAKICFQDESLQNNQNAIAKIRFKDDSLQNVQNASAKICFKDDSLKIDQNASEINSVNRGERITNAIQNVSAMNSADRAQKIPNETHDINKNKINFLSHAEEFHLQEQVEEIADLPVKPEEIKIITESLELHALNTLSPECYYGDFNFGSCPSRNKEDNEDLATFAYYIKSSESPSQKEEYKAIPEFRPNKESVCIESSPEAEFCTGKDTLCVEEDERRVRRCSSLKTGKTPPGTPGRKKIVRFADVLGLDLADVRTFLDEIPKIPSSAYNDLIAETDFPAYTNPSLKNQRVLLGMFRQPGGQSNFLEKVTISQVMLENAVVEDPISFSIRGLVRVRNLDFDKQVHVRYSLDSWKTFSDLQAVYVENSCDGFTDKFTFLLYAYSLSIGQKIEFAIRFQSKGAQFWDNNAGINYCFQCLPASNPSSYAPLSVGVDDQIATFYYMEATSTASIHDLKENELTNTAVQQYIMKSLQKNKMATSQMSKGELYTILVVLFLSVVFLYIKLH